MSPVLSTSEEKIKIFTWGTSDKFEELESEVNKWLAELDPLANIHCREVRTVAAVNIEDRTFVNCTIVIFYNTPK